MHHVGKLVKIYRRQENWVGIDDLIGVQETFAVTVVLSAITDDYPSVVAKPGPPVLLRVALGQES